VSARRSPRPLAGALRRARKHAEPLTLLAAAQSAWPAAAGARVAAEAEPVAERDGVVTIACRSATWAQELDLLQPELLERLKEALSGAGRSANEATVRALRFTADASRHIE
jgi:predicted nucleic acid-binding Zn ribbon protein